MGNQHAACRKRLRVKSDTGSGCFVSQTCGQLLYKAPIPISLETNISVTPTVQTCIGSNFVVLIMMNGRTLSYKLPLSVFDIKCKLPRLPAYTIYKIMNDTKVLEGLHILKDADYYLTVVVSKVDLANWIPMSWNGVVPRQACDLFGDLPPSPCEAGRVIYRLVMLMLACLDGDDLGYDDDDLRLAYLGWSFQSIEYYVEMAAHSIISNDGWRQWLSLKYSLDGLDSELMEWRLDRWCS